MSTDPDTQQPEGLSPAELEAQVGEALPERALMSTVSLSPLDPTADAADAVTDSVVTTTTAAAADPAAATSATDPAAESAPVEASSEPVQEVTTTVGETIPPIDDTAGPVGDTVNETVPSVNDTVGPVGDTVNETVPAVNDTVGPVGDTVNETLPAVNDTAGTVGDTVNETLPSVNDTIGTVADPDLPALLESLRGTSLLDLNVDLDAALDATAPISAAIAANANVAAPIDAAVSANILSPNSVSLADAQQQALLSQQLAGAANAESNQLSSIDQAEAAGGDVETAPVSETVGDLAGDALPAETPSDAVETTADAMTTPAEALDSAALLDVDLDLDLDLDVAAPIQATVAANANVAAPIDAAVSANVLSPGAVSLANADQAAVIQQTLLGEANATSNQNSAIEQGDNGGIDDVGGAQTSLTEDDDGTA
jgi:hypothetical protein